MPSEESKRIRATLVNLPTLFIQAGDHEVLLRDATRLTERAEAAGVEVRLEVWEEMWHVWQAWAASLPEGQQALDHIGAFVRQNSHMGYTGMQVS